MSYEMHLIVDIVLWSIAFIGLALLLTPWGRKKLEKLTKTLNLGKND